MFGFRGCKALKTLLAIQDEIIASMEKKNRELSQIVREHEDLDRFISQLNEKCLREGMQFCGLRKVSPKDEPSFYVGFVMFIPKSIEPNTSYHFDIYGYRCTGLGRLSEVYRAHVRHSLCPAPYDIDNSLELIENIAKKSYRGSGIGAAGMSIIKDLALQLHCSKIYGRRVPETPADLEKLKRFYATHGFEQSDDNDSIRFDLTGYGNASDQLGETE